MYKHSRARFNYTTYDIRREQDIINPNSSQRNVMVLNNVDDDHPFAYAQVLGIYHVNVVLKGPETVNLRPRRLDFLWVRWYRTTSNHSWQSYKLDCVRFPPMADEDAFGFLDPRDVLRACHLIPRFSTARVHSDGIGLSRVARDGRDWHQYVVNRCNLDSKL